MTQPRPKTQRRQVVVLCYGSALVAVVLGAIKTTGLSSSLDISFSILIMLGLLASGYAAIRLLQPKQLGISDGPDNELDERQLQVRNQAYLNAYRILGGFVVIGLAFASIFWNQVRQLPDSIALSAFFWLVILLAISLPAALLAWLEPEPIGE